LSLSQVDLVPVATVAKVATVAVVAEVPVEVGTVAVAAPVVAIAAELDCVMPEVVLDWIAVAASPAVGLSLGVIVAVAVPVGVPSELLSPPPVYALMGIVEFTDGRIE
jgi:hypothetical protein